MLNMTSPPLTMDSTVKFINSFKLQISLADSSRAFAQGATFINNGTFVVSISSTSLLRIYSLQSTGTFQISSGT